MGTPSEQLHFAEKKGRDQKGEVGMVVGFPELAEPTEYGPGGAGFILCLPKIQQPRYPTAPDMSALCVRVSLRCRPSLN